MSDTRYASHRREVTRSTETTQVNARPTAKPERRLPLTLLRAWRRCFVNRPQPYAVQQPEGSYRWVHAECDLEELRAHLDGEWTLALSSSDKKARCKWLCLDVDAVGAQVVAQLVVLCTALADRGWPGLVEASRRGGHLWFLLDEPLPVAIAHSVLHTTLERLSADGLPLPPYELYPLNATVGALGQAVRLPLGIHQLTGQRYPLFDAEGFPCAFTTRRAAVQFVLDQPRVSSEHVLERWVGLGHGVGDLAPPQRSEEADTTPGATAAQPPPGGRIGTHSPVIRWVDRHVSPLELLADLEPDTELRQVGRGYLGWCPFHDDRAADDAGHPGMPSFYVVQDHRYGWTWKCFSTNCHYSWGLPRHTFELFCCLLDLSVRAGIIEACERWPEADPTVPHHPHHAHQPH